MKPKEEFAHYVASLAQRAILYEVSTTPKPGLVDRNNSGAHKDMDFFTFMASSSVLYRGLYECTKEGLSFDETDDTELLNRIRIPGSKCEKMMLEATHGVNTHKGIIFSMGILCSAVGKLHRENEFNTFISEDICEKVKEIAKDLTVRDFEGVWDKEVLTHSEVLFREYGYKGIRGEVESGFKTVREKALPVLKKWKNDNQLSMNDLFLEILINIMAKSEDTNVIIRGGMEGLNYVRSVSENFLKSGGMGTPDAEIRLKIMDMDFIKRNISPGGAADLLAVSIFLGLMEGIIK